MAEESRDLSEGAKKVIIGLVVAVFVVAMISIAFGKPGHSACEQRAQDDWMRMNRESGHASLNPIKSSRQMDDYVYEICGN